MELNLEKNTERKRERTKPNKKWQIEFYPEACLAMGNKGYTPQVN